MDVAVSSGGELGRMICELCEEEEVICFCPDCNFTLGEFCQSVHRKQKATKAHTLKDISEVKIPDLGIQCTTCDSLAITYCPECEERQCEKCSRIHKKLPATKTHELIDTLPTNTPSNAEETNIPAEPGEELRQISDSSFGDCQSTLQDEDESLLVDTPGKPYLVEASIDCIDLTWTMTDHVTDTDVYQVRFKESLDGKWKPYREDFGQDIGRICGLKPETFYVFSVRLLRNDVESPYSEESDVIQTHASFASQIVQSAIVARNKDKCPEIFALPMTEILSARNDEDLTQKFEIGPIVNSDALEKTILLIGANGVGKTTFLDGMANYVLGVTFEDTFRFTTTQDDSDRPDCQTKWITCYTFNPQQGTRIDYKLNVIHTPGFAETETRNEDRDQQLIEQIQALFGGKDEKGVQYIDAICFLVKAPDTCLTATQKYIFNAVMAMFGKAFEQNICTLFTFADCAVPNILPAVEGCDFTFGEYFSFNNSALFVSNAEDSDGYIRKQWDICFKKYGTFQGHLQTLETKSTPELNKEVTEERLQLEETVLDLRPKIDAGLSIIHRFKDEKKKFEENQAIIESNRNFEYQVTELMQLKVPLEPGHNVTNCLQCNVTCHDDCKINDDVKKYKCSAMDASGYCKSCFSRCHWTQHKNAPFIIRYGEDTVTKTYDDMLQKYQKAESNCVTLQQVLCKLDDELSDEKGSTGHMMEEFKNNKNRLKAIALRPNPVGMVEQIDLLIQAEDVEKRPGYRIRIEVLNDFRRDAGNDDAWRKILRK